MIELLYLSIFLLGMAAGAWLMSLVLGPDPDLAGPWDPRDE